jgi:hypothetical protein
MSRLLQVAAERRAWTFLSNRDSASCVPAEPADDPRNRAETFRPYLEARDWITIQKETP